MKRRVAIAYVGILLGAAGSSAAESIAPADGAPHRYVLVLDTSFSMGRISVAAGGTLGQLLGSGLMGRMRPGDLFEVWTYDRRIAMAAFPPQPWLEERGTALAVQAVDFARQQGWNNRDRSDAAIERLKRVFARTPNVTVVIVTDAEDRMRGTPFDAALNAALLKQRPASRKERRPCLVTIESTNGSLTSWSVGDIAKVGQVNRSGQVRLAFAVVSEAAAKPAESETPSPAAPAPETLKEISAAAKANEQVAPPPPVSEPQPPAQVREQAPQAPATLAAEKAPPDSGKPNLETETLPASVPAQEQSQPVTDAKPAPEPAQQQPVVPPTPESVPQAVQAKPETRAATPSPPVDEAVARQDADKHSEATSAPAKPPVGKAAQGQVGVLAPSQGEPARRLELVVGASLVLLGAGIVARFALRRQKHRQASLITRYLDRNRG